MLASIYGGEHLFFSLQFVNPFFFSCVLLTTAKLSCDHFQGSVLFHEKHCKCGSVLFS